MRRKAQGPQWSDALLVSDKNNVGNGVLSQHKEKLSLSRGGFKGACNGCAVLYCGCEGAATGKRK